LGVNSGGIDLQTRLEVNLEHYGAPAVRPPAHVYGPKIESSGPNGLNAGLSADVDLVVVPGSMLAAIADTPAPPVATEPGVRVSEPLPGPLGTGQDTAAIDNVEAHFPIRGHERHPVIWLGGRIQQVPGLVVVQGSPQPARCTSYIVRDGGNPGLLQRQ